MAPSSPPAAPVAQGFPCRELFADSPDFIHLVDADGRLQAINPSELAALGYTEEEVLGQPVEDLIHPEAVSGFRGRLARVLRDGERHEVNTILRRRDGSPLEVRARVFPRREGNRVIGAGAVLQDLSVQREESRRQQRAQAQLRAVTSTSPDWLGLLDLDGCIEFVSRDMGAGRVEELLGRPAADLVQEPDRSALLQALDEVRRTRQAASLRVRWSTPTGELRHYGLRLGPVVYGDRVTGFAATLHEVTREVRFERAVHDMIAASSVVGPEFFRRIVLSLARSLSADGALVGRVIDDGRSVRTLGVVVDGRRVADFAYELEGTPCANVLDSGQCVYPREVAEHFPEDTMLADLELQAYVGIPLRSAGGGAIGILVVLFRRPLEEAETAETLLQLFAARAAAELERMLNVERVLASSRLIALGQMSASVAHELNQPLTAMSVLAEGLQLRLEGGQEVEPQKLHGWSEDILSQVERMHVVIEHMRRFSRAEADLEVLDLNEVIDLTVDMAASRLGNHGIRVRLQLGAGPLRVCGNRFRLEEVFINLLTNAADALEEGGGPVRDVPPTITVSTGRDGDYVVAVIEDNGPGLPEAVSRRAFEPFFTTKDADHGTGLGLSICAGILGDHGGGIDLENTDGGAAARLWLPVVAEREA